MKLRGKRLEFVVNRGAANLFADSVQLNVWKCR